LKHYFLRWEIDIHAETAREAAEEALKIQRDPGSTATVFEVIDTETGDTTTIDLEEEEGGPEDGKIRNGF